MSGGSMNYFYQKVQAIADAFCEVNTEHGLEIKEATDPADLYESPLRPQFLAHLRTLAAQLELAAAALRAIEWNDSGDGAKDEDALIRACIEKHGL